MSPLMTTLLNSTTQTLETSSLIVAAVAAFAARITRPAPARPKPGPVDRHTMTDIGVEPGSITWLR